MIGANELKRKALIMVEGQPYQVVDVFFATPSARGASTMVRAKVRHLLTGAAHDKNFKTSEKFNEPDVSFAEANYLYKDGSDYYFMDQSVFEMVSIPEATVGDMAHFLHEQLGVKILKYQGSPAALELPLWVNLKVEETEPEGQYSGSAGTKNATLETGLVVRVPRHIAVGESVRISTETGEFLSRA